MGALTPWFTTLPKTPIRQTTTAFYKGAVIMNKQQLANKIWESANKMRSKIEANEYKDYILGFIFYKFLSDKEVDFLKKDGYEETDLQEHVHENNEELVDYCQQHLGYFIAYDNLFSTWLDKGNSFTVDNVRTALSAFNRLISDTQKKVFSKIFNTLETGLSKLGDSTSNQTKAIRDLIQLMVPCLPRTKALPLVSIWTARKTFWVCGSVKMRAPNSGQRYSIA